MPFMAHKVLKGEEKKQFVADYEPTIETLTGKPLTLLDEQVRTHIAKIRRIKEAEDILIVLVGNKLIWSFEDK